MGFRGGIPEGIPFFVRKALDQSQSNNTVLADDNELLFVGIPATQLVHIYGLIIIDAASGTPDFKYSLSGISAGDLRGFTSIGTALQTSFETPAAGSQVNVSNGGTTRLRLDGWAQKNALGGNIAFQWAQVLTSASAVTVRAGSYIACEKIVEQS